MNDDLPAEIDATLVPRLPLRIAAKYIGRSARWLQREVQEGRIRAIDTGTPSKACWAIAVPELRAFIVAFELRAKARQDAYQAAKNQRVRSE